MPISAYLLKPIRQSELREAIARVLGAKEQQGAIPLITRYSLYDARDPETVLSVLLMAEAASSASDGARLNPEFALLKFPQPERDT